MKNAIENLRRKIKAWLAQEQRVRRRKLQVVRLEDRRLPDASFGIMEGLLALDGFDRGDTLTVDGDLSGGADGAFTLLTGKWDSFDSDLRTGPFPLSNMNHTLNPGPATIDALHINAVDSLTAINTSPTGVQAGSLQNAGGGALDLTDINTDFDTISMTADSLSLNDVDGVAIGHLETTGAATIVAGGGITDVAHVDDTTIDVGGDTSCSATNITLGDHSLDHTYFHSLSFVATGDVEIPADDSMTVNDASSGHHVSLVSSNDVTLDGMLHSTGDVSITADTTTGGVDVNAELSATGSILLNPADEITIDARNDSVSVTLEADDDITINAPVVATDLITIAAGQDGSGSVFRNLSGSLAANYADDTADIIINSGTTSGAVTLNAGVLDVAGIINGSVTLNGGTLRGTGGTINGAVTVNAGATLSPGNSPGILSTGNLNFSNNSTFTVEIQDGNSSGSVAGTDYDQVRVTGTVVIGTNVTLNLQDLGSTHANPREVYTIIDNDGTADAVTGTFAGLANGAFVTAVGGISYRIFYNGGDGNDVVLIGRPVALPNVYISNSFTQNPGTVIADVDFITPGNQPGVYGIDGFLTIAEGIAAIDSGGTIHVDTGTFIHNGTLTVNKSVTIDGQGMNLTSLQKAGAPAGNFDVAIRISADNVTISNVKLGWQVYSTHVASTAVDYKGYVVITTADHTTIDHVRFGSNTTGEGYRSAVVFEGTSGNGADFLTVSNSIFEGRWGRAAIRDGDSGSGENFLITGNEFREDHFRWGPIAIGPQDSAGTPNNFAFSGEISFNYFGNGLDAIDFQSGGNQNYTVTITNQGLTSAGLKILHNTLDWNDSNVKNQNGVYAQPAGVYITPSFTGNTDKILIQDNIFNNFAYAGPQPGTTDPLWHPLNGVFGGALEFDGVDDFGVWQSNLFDVGATGTLNFWVKMDNVTRRNQFFEGPGNAGLEMQFRNNSGGQIYGRTTTVGGDVVLRSGPDGATLLNTWHNIQYTWNFNAINAVGRMHIYVDGVESGYLTGSTPYDLTWGAVVSTVNGLMNIGRDPGDAGRYFDGMMDDVGWFNSVLTSAELEQIRLTSGIGVAALAADSRLVAHWDFDQSTGNIAVDNKNGIQMYLSTNGIAPLGPTYLAGQGRTGLPSDGALEFDGLDDLATFQDPTFDVGTKGSLNFWVKMDDVSRRNQFFEGPDNAGMEFQFRNNSSGQLYGRTTTVGGDFVIRSGPDGATLLNTWHNIQYTWDFGATNAVGKMRIYVDGVESGYVSGFTPNDLNWGAVTDTVNGLMNVGRDPGDILRFFDGKMDDIAWYNDVLTSTELSTVRTSGVTAHPDLIASWNFDTAPTVDNTYFGNNGTSIVLYLQQLPPLPAVSGYGVVTPVAAVVRNNVFFNDVPGRYADSNHPLDSSNITGPTANPFFNGDQVGYAGTTLQEFYTLRFGSSAAYQSTEFQASIATAIPHIGAYQDAPVAVGIEDMLIVGTDQDDLLVVTFTSESAGSFVLTTGVGSPGEFTLGPIAFSNITSITFDSYGGDDVMQIIQPSNGFITVSGGIFFNAGSEHSDGIGNDAVTGIDGDTLILSSAAISPAIADIVEYVFENRVVAGHVGSITITDASINSGAGGSTTIFYNGLEPRIFDSLNVDHRIFTFRSTAATETITLQSPGDPLATTGFQNKIGSSTGATPLSESVSFSNPNISLTINAGDGDQTIDVSSLHTDFRAAIAINGDAGNDVVNFNSTLGTLLLGLGSVTGTLNVNAETIIINAGVSIDTTGGNADGDVTLTAVAAITLNDSATLTTSAADVSVTADGNVRISRILSANLVTITSNNAGIIDNRTTDELANITANSAVLNAATGIGATDDLNTAISQLTLNNSTSGNVQIVNSSNLSLGPASAVSGEMTICVTSGDLTLTDNLTAIGNTVRLQAADNVIQTALGLIIAANLSVRANNNINLDDAANNVTGIFAAISLTAGDLEFTDVDGFTVGSVTAGNCVPQVDGITAIGGNVVATSTGSISVDKPVSASANIALNTSGLLTVNAVVSSTTGNLNLTGGTGVTHNAAGDLSTTGVGKIDVTATTNDITMADGTVYSTGSGNVTLLAATNVRLGQITTTSSAIGITATAGAIRDNTALEGTGNENLRGSDIVLLAATGIGSEGGMVGDNGDIDFVATTLNATNTSSGRIQFATANSIALKLLSNAGRTIVLDAGGAITDGNGNVGSDNVVAQDLVLRAVGGIGSANSLEIGVTNLAFVNSGSGNVQLTDVGGMTVKSLGGLASSGSTTGTITLSATGPVIFDASTTGSGTVTITAIEGSTINTENISVSAGVTIKSTGGDMILQAGDRINLAATSTVEATLGSVVLSSGFGDTDDDGSQTLNGLVKAADRITINLNAESGAATEGSTGSLVAANLLLLSTGDGTFSLDATTTNNVATLAANVTGAVAYRDADALAIGTVGGTNGITTTDDNVTVCLITGNLTLAQNISTGTAGPTIGIVRLQTLSTAGSITQSSGRVVASALGVRAGTGGISLNSVSNDVDILALTTTGTVSFVDADGFTLGSVAASGCFNPGVNGLSAGGDVTLCATSGNISVTQALSSGGFTVRLEASTGNVTQSSNGVITATNLGVRASGNIDLDVATGRNNIASVFAAISTTAGVIEFTDNGGFTVGTVSAQGCFGGAVGVNANAGSVQLTSDAGSITNVDGVTAGGSGNITLTTTTSGNVIFTGTTTAEGDLVTITSIQAINGGGLVTANTVDLNATTGVGNSSVVNLVATHISADTTNGNIDLNNTLASATLVSSLTTGNGSITFDQFGGAVTFTGTVTSGNPATGGSITLTSTAGLTVDAASTVSSAGGTGGELAISGATIHGAVSTGAGQILIHGSFIDTIIDSATTLTGSASIGLSAVQDIIVRSQIQATFDISLTADTGSGPLAGDGRGGVFIDEAGSANNARLVAGRDIMLSGSDLVADGDTFAPGGALDTHQSIRISSDTVAGTNQISAGRDIILVSGASSATGADAPNIEINGKVAATMGGLIRVTAARDVQFDTDATSNDETLTTTGRVEITATTGAIVDANATREAVLIYATDLAMQAATGIGNFNSTIAGDEAKDIDVQVSNLAAITASGDIFVSDSGALTIGTVSQGNGSLSGVRISSGTSTDDILIRELGGENFTINQEIRNTGGGHITLAALGQSGTDSLVINANVTSNDGGATTSGDVRLFSESHFTLQNNAVVNSNGGDALLVAGSAFQYNGSQVVGDADANLTMASGALLTTTASASAGNALLTATNNVLLSVVNAGTVTNSATVYVIADAGIPDGAGQILDNQTDALAENETVNITAANLALSAGTGIGVDVLNAQDNTEFGEIDTSVGKLAAVTDSGSVFIRNINPTTTGLAIGTVSGMSFTVAGITTFAPASLSGVTISDNPALGSDVLKSGLDAIAIRAVSNGTTNGSITVTQNITNNDAGNITLSAEGGSAADDLTLAANVSSVGTSSVVDSTTGGNIRVFAGDTIAVGTSTARTISTQGTGQIFLYAGSNRFSNLGGSSSGDVTMFSGSTLSSTSGNVGVIAAGSISLSRITTAGNVAVRADSRMTINAGAVASTFSLNGTGAITDVLSGDGVGNENIIAANLQLTSATGIGTDSNAIDTRVSGVVARTVVGDIHLDNTNDLAVLAGFSLAFSPAVGLNSPLNTTLGIVIATGGIGDNVVVQNRGMITINGSIMNASVGNILLRADAATNDIVLNAAVSSSGGHITLMAQDDITQAVAVTVSTAGSGTIFVEAGADAGTNFGVYTMSTSAVLSSVNGDIHVKADQQVTVGRIITDADVAVISVFSQIVDADADNLTTDITASGLRLNAATGIGTSTNAIETSVNTLSGRVTGSGIVNILESNGVTVTDVDVVTQNVNSDGTTTTITDALQSDLVNANGSIVLRSQAGPITLDDGTSTAIGGNDGNAAVAGGSGNVLIQTEAAGTDITVNADVRSTTGHITLMAEENITLTANVDAVTGGAGTIVLDAGADAITNTGFVMMAPSATLQTVNGDIRVKADTNVTIGNLTASNANVSLISVFGSILDADVDDTNLDVTALGLRMNAAVGIGTLGVGSNAIEMSVNTLSARAGAGGISVIEANGITVDNVTVTTLKVQTNSTVNAVIDAMQSDLVTTANGSIVLRAQTGTVTLNDGTAAADGDAVVANGSGNVLIHTEAATGDIVVNANIVSGTGHITLVSGDDVRQNANLSTAGGSIYIFAANGEVNGVGVDGIVMATGTTTSSGGGNILLTAGGESDIRLGLVNAGTGNVSLSAQRDILNSGVTKNVQASQLRMVADSNGNGAGQIGQGDGASAPGTNNNAVATEVTTLAASSADGIYVLESDSVTVDRIAAFNVSQVNFNATTTTQTAAALEDLVTTDAGVIKLVSTTGNITINAGTPATAGVTAARAGNVLLQTLAAAGDIIVNANITSTAGHITLNAGDDIDLNANVQTGGTGTVYLLASNRTSDAITGIDMQSGTSITTAGRNVRLVADNEADILLGLINAGSGNVSLIAERSILDNNGSATNVQANALRMVADAAVSNVSNQSGIIGGADLLNATPADNIHAIDTQVTTLAAQSAQGIYVLEADGLRVVATGEISVEQVNFNSTTTTRTDATLSSLTTTANGPIKLQSTTSNLTIGSTISANGSGNVLLQTQAATGDIIVNANMTSGTGYITVNAARDADINATVTTGGSGTVYVNAVQDIDSDAVITTASGDVLLSAGRDIRQTQLITSANGDIGVVAAQDVTQTAHGDITTISGDVLVKATLGNLMMDGNATVTVGGGDMLLLAGNNIVLGVITMTNATSNRVAVQATLGSITDANAEEINIQETVAGSTTSVSLRAGTMIGGVGGTQNSVNDQALDLNVDTVAATSATGIYLREVIAGGAIQVNTAAAVSVTIDGVRRADFNSGLTDVSQGDSRASLEDLRTTNNGPIKLVAEADTITVNAGTVGTVGVSAHGTGDVLLEARGVSSDVIVNASVQSGTGHITLNAGDDVIVNATITTGTNITKSGTVYLLAGNSNFGDAVGFNVDGININGAITTMDGDILVESKSTGNIRQTKSITTTGGDVGLIAASDITQTSSGHITSIGGDVLIDAGRNWTMDGVTTISVGGADMLGLAGNNIVLGVISGTNATENRIALQATRGDITDANSDSINIQESVAAAVTSVSLRAGSTIGSADGVNGSAVNNNAVDLNVDTVAAIADTGIYLREVAAGGPVEINTAAAVMVNIDSVVVSNFNSTTTSVSQNRRLDSLEDLVTRASAPNSAGPIKLVAEGGTITVNGGADGSGISAGGRGDVLVEARGADSDVIVNAAIRSGSGHVTLDAEDDIDLRAAVVTGGMGTVYFRANNGTAGDALLSDGININASITTIDGDVLLESAFNIRQNSSINSTNGDIGLIASNNVTQTNNGNITTIRGDVLIDAGRDWAMAGTTVITAGGQQMLGTAGRNIAVGVISVTNAVENHIALNAGANITDANASDINIQEVPASHPPTAPKTTLSLRAGGMIGGVGGATASVNDNAIDINVDIVAASAGTGIFLREVGAGGAIEVNTADAVKVNIAGVRRANFDSSTSDASKDRTIQSLEDLTTTNGPIKLVAENGPMTINAGPSATNNVGITAGRNGNVLLEARTAGDVIVNADIVSGSGNITLNAADDIHLAGAITTGSDGSIYLRATNVAAGDSMSPSLDGINVDGILTTSNGDILLSSTQDIRITKLITSTTGDVGIIAGRDIVQENMGDITTGGDVLVEAGRNWTMATDATITATGGEVDGHAVRGDLELGRINSSHVALTARGSIIDANGGLLNVDATTLSLRAENGLIGNHDITNGTPTVNVNAIDTRVTTLAANAESGIYIHEADGVTINTVARVQVNVDRPVQVNFNDTTINVGQLRSTALLEDLTTDTNGPIKIVAAAGTLTIKGGTDSSGVYANGTGDVLLQAVGLASHVVVDAAVDSGTGNITLNAGDDIDINASVTTSSTGTIYATAANGTNNAIGTEVDGINVNGVVTTVNGHVLLDSARDIRVTHAIKSTNGHIGLMATRNIIQDASGDITTGGNAFVEAGNDWTMDSDAVITANGGEVIGTAISGNLTLGRINSTNVALTAGNNIFDANAGAVNVVAVTLSMRANNGMIGISANAIDTTVTTLAANAKSGISIQETDDLIIDTVRAVTVSQGNVLVPHPGNPVRVNFNSTTTAVAETRTTASLEDLTTSSNGTIKVITTNGSLTVNRGANAAYGISANGTGDVQLESRGFASDIVVNGNIRSGSGSIMLTTGRDIDLNANISTMGNGNVTFIAMRDILQTDAGDVNTASGSVLVDAGRNWLMATDAVIDAGGNVGGRAVSGELFLGRINATHVALTAGRSISDSNGTVLNVMADTLSMVAGQLIGDHDNPSNTPSMHADAIDTQVNTIAAQSRNGLYVNETDNLIVGSVAELTVGMVTFGNVNGLRTTNGDMFLNTGRDLTLSQRVNAGSADVRITTTGSVTQNGAGIIIADELGIRQASTSRGDVRLFSGNDVNILAVRNDFEGGDIDFADIDDLTIRSVSSQTVGILSFSTTEGIVARGGDVNVRAERDLTILRSIASVNGVEDKTAASGESILLESVNGNILVDAGTGVIFITTDEAPGSNAATGDRISLVADTDYTDRVNEGKVTFVGDVTLSTDGGVAKKFGPRPAVGEAATAFFIYSSNPLPQTLDNVPGVWNGANAYINAFNVEIGIGGEENLTVDIDWRDPADETGVIRDNATQLFTRGLGVYNAVSSERIQQFLVVNGGQVNTVGHLYTALDFSLFQTQLNITTIVVDLSVSHHASINVTGSFVEQSNTTQFVPGRDIASTDNVLTGPGQFENGIATFRIPTTTPAPIALFNPEPAPRVDRPIGAIPLENKAGLLSQVVTDSGGSAVSGSAFSTDVYFQIRRQFETDGPAEIVVERITDSRLISSREAFEEFVRQKPELQDGAGYEIWLISETSGQKVERPVVEFEITGGRPGPASEEMPDTSELPRLKDLPFEQPTEDETPAADDSPQASNIGPSGQIVGDVDDLIAIEAVDPATDPEADPQAGDLSSMNVHTAPGAGLTITSGTIASLAVSRFRAHQRKSETDDRKYSRAARFTRRNT